MTAPPNFSCGTGAFGRSIPPMDWLDKLFRFWPHLVAGLDFAAALLASIHALLHKRDSRAATLWLGIIWLLPVAGPLLYFALGFNRIRRRAIALGVHNTTSRPLPDNLGEPEHSGAEHLQMPAVEVRLGLLESLLYEQRGPGREVV